MHRILPFLALLALIAAGAPAHAADLDVPAALADRILGNPDAPITITEFSSLTCPHCADFHAETMPKIKAEWIDTGKARLIISEFPLDGVALRAAALSRCVAPERFYPIVDVLFKTQAQWERAADPVKALSQTGKLAGLDQAHIDACVANKALTDGILQKRMLAEKQYKVESTPTFVFSGPNGGSDTLVGAEPYDAFDKVLTALYAKK
ncbi:MAG: thioredoxin domain-containing protein [Azospirillaceae bacterium]|nr:thioredoxin domain-containing protein [Azospirillaceae bacterium]